MREIPLTRGYVALVDKDDFQTVAAHRWYAMKGDKFGNLVYAARKVGNQTILMHRQITEAAPGEFVDHCNRNGLDNQRANLRVCTNSQNQANQTLRAAKAQSRFKGVRRSYRRWAAQIEVMGKTIYLGTFGSEESAARAYDDAARQHFGDFARTNFVREETV